MTDTPPDPRKEMAADWLRSLTRDQLTVALNRELVALAMKDGVAKFNQTSYPWKEISLDPADALARPPAKHGSGNAIARLTETVCAAHSIDRDMALDATAMKGYADQIRCKLEQQIARSWGERAAANLLTYDCAVTQNNLTGGEETRVSGVPNLSAVKLLYEEMLRQKGYRGALDYPPLPSTPPSLDAAKIKTEARAEAAKQVVADLEKWAADLAPRLLGETSGRLVLDMLRQQLKHMQVAK